MKKLYLALLIGLITWFIVSEVFAFGVQLRWDPNTEPDLAGYKVCYGFSDISSYMDNPDSDLRYSEFICIDVGNVVTYRVENLDRDQPYCFVARSYDIYGNDSGYSNEAFHPGVNFSWDEVDVPDLAGYKIYYGLESGNYTNVVDVGLVHVFSLRGLEPGITYYFVITAYDNDGYESPYCPEIVHDPVPLLVQNFKIDSFVQ